MGAVPVRAGWRAGGEAPAAGGRRLGRWPPLLRAREPAAATAPTNPHIRGERAVDAAQDDHLQARVPRRPRRASALRWADALRARPRHVDLQLVRLRDAGALSRARN